MENMNALEQWSLYDTVLIGDGMGSVNGAKWYNSFADLSNETEIPFFNQRNRSGVGVPYCSFDSAEQIPFAFRCASIGVEWYSPPWGDCQFGAPAVDPDDQVNYLIWAGDMLKHAAIRLQVSQDEKMAFNCISVPGGAGPSQFLTAYSISSVNQSGHYCGMTNGVPFIGNRWLFPEPIEIPRNRNIAAWIVFSNYARGELAKMQGPKRIPINPEFPDPETQLPTYESTTVPGVCMIRLSMFGQREVQQRNELRFA